MYKEVSDLLGDTLLHIKCAKLCCFMLPWCRSTWSHEPPIALLKTILKLFKPTARTSHFATCPQNCKHHASLACVVEVFRDNLRSCHTNNKTSARIKQGSMPQQCRLSHKRHVRWMNTIVLRGASWTSILVGIAGCRTKRRTRWAKTCFSVQVPWDPISALTFLLCNVRICLRDTTSWLCVSLLIQTILFLCVYIYMLLT